MPLVHRIFCRLRRCDDWVFTVDSGATGLRVFFGFARSCLGGRRIARRASAGSGDLDAHPPSCLS